MVLKASDLRTGVFVDWCPGCGDFGILSALQMALAELDVEPHKTVLVSGIGQAGKTSHFVKVNGVHTLHGRLLPYAIGIKVANPDLEVIAVGGDGDGLGIGAGHFVNAGRRNVDMTYLLHNNGVYGLTKGQASPTLRLGLQTKSLPRPNINQAVNPIALALVSGYTFIARSYAFDVRHLKETIKQGIQHKGMAFIEILQPCPTYNDINTKDWYEGEDRPDPKTGEPRPRTFRLDDRGFDPNVKDDGDEHRKMAAALKESLEMGEQMPIGVFYRNERESTYQERLMHRIPFYLDMPPSRQTLIDNNGRSVANLKALFEDLKT